MDEEVIHLNESDVKNLQFDSTETEIDLGRVKKELKLQNDFQWTSHCLVYLDEEPHLKYTPMQFSSKYGLVKVVQLLLESNIDPNFKENNETKQHKRHSIRFVRRQNSTGIKDPKVDSGRKENCDEYPLLLAAQNGHHEILKLFKYHNFSDPPKDATELVQHNVVINEDIELKHLMSCDTGPKTHNVNFRARNNDNQTVLHVVLQQPLLALETSSDETRRTNKSIKRKITYPYQNNRLDMKNKHLQDIALKYRECIKILLDLDRFENKNREIKSSKSETQLNSSLYSMQIRSIINDKDVDGNTPLHCAVLNWSEDVVKKLLTLGANACIKNKQNEIALTRISRTAFEDFLNKQCIIVEGFDTSDDELKEDSDGEDDSKVTQDYNPAFMMRISQCGLDTGNEMKFDYGFLSPQGTRKRNTQRKHLTRQESGNTLPERDVEGQAVQEGGDTYLQQYKPEMDLLWAMSQSKIHCPLIVHPVIDSYLWIKWKLMTRFFNRNLRIDFLFLYCFIWYIFTHYGGKKWNSVTIVNDKETNTYISKFCKPANFTFSVIDFTKIRLLDYVMSWYYLFVFIFIFLILNMMRDLRRDIAMYFSQDYRTSQQSPIVASWVDLGTLSLSILTLLGGSDLLWLVLTIILIFSVLVELIQIFSLKWRYFVEISNWIDLGIIAVAFIVLYLPPEFVKNPKIFSIISGKEDGNQNEHEDGTSNCRIMRSMSATAIVLVSVRFLMLISKLPILKNYNLYVIMFFKVMKTYVKIMIWYGFYIIAFGLGFYIMLHDDTKEREILTLGNSPNSSSGFNSSKEEGGKNKFRNPLLAVIKTSTMFVGEIEFGDLPIEGGDISVSMVYCFLVLFIFLMIIVLMNLLNGLAVSDTGQMIRDSLIESQISLISTIRLYESIYLGQMENNERGVVKSFLERYMVPKGILLFHSPYLVDDNRKLTLPLKTKVHDDLDDFVCFSSCPGASVERKNRCNRFVEWYLGNDENEGCDEFLENARNILIEERSKKVEERRRKYLRERKKERRDKKEIMSSKIELINKSLITLSKQNSV